MYKIIFLPLVILSISLAAARDGNGDERGNGGDVLECSFADSPVTLELLDIFETREIHEKELSLGDNSLTVEKKVEIVLNRLKLFSKRRALKYKKWFDSFYKESKFLKDVNFGDIQDSSHIFIPNNCKLKQIINQQNPRFSNDKRYFINKNLWDQLDNNNRAALILHELIYREMQTPTSIPVRRFIAYLISDALNNFTPEDFLRLAKEIGLNSLEIQSVLVDLSQYFAFYPNGQLKSAVPIKNSTFLYQSQELIINRFISFYDNGQLNKLWGENTFHYQSPFIEQAIPLYGIYGITFYENGTVEFGETSSNILINGKNFEIMVPNGSRVKFYVDGRPKHFKYMSGKVLLNSTIIELSDYPNVQKNIKFYESGGLKNFFIEQARFKIGPRNIKLSNTIHLDGLGNIIKSTLAKEGLLFQALGNSIFFKPHSTISFFPSGNIKCGELGRKVQLNWYNGRQVVFDKNKYLCFKNH